MEAAKSLPDLIKSHPLYLHPDVPPLPQKLTLNPPPSVLMPPTGLFINQEFSATVEPQPTTLSWLLDMIPMEIGLLRTLGELLGESGDILPLKQETLVPFALNLLTPTETKNKT